MKIGGKKGVSTETFVKKAGDAAQANKPQAAGKTATQGSDNVDISSKARELNTAKGLLENVPDVRVDMVGRIKTDIERGDYNVDAGKVAEKMIERALRDALESKK
ncbi:MAG: flagellar biosynthesis anti-sigma factor FlgM [Deltaproteobacteria bacterium]|nr:flagellar biosynthesis anti-sigma factor FlgM [Deltaproteobacteria bacterium]